MVNLPLASIAPYPLDSCWLPLLRSAPLANVAPRADRANASRTPPIAKS